MGEGLSICEPGPGELPGLGGTPLAGEDHHQGEVISAPRRPPEGLRRGLWWEANLLSSLVLGCFQSVFSGCDFWYGYSSPMAKHCQYPEGY